MNSGNRDRLGLWAGLLGTLALCVLAARYLALRLDVSYKLAYLVAMILASALMSGLLVLLRYRLKRRLESMSEAETQALELISPEIRYELRRQSPFNVVTIAGVIAINGMILPLLIGPLAFLQYVLEVRAPALLALSLVVGFILAWSWWSAGVTLWRAWARRSGMAHEEVQWRGERATLLWPKGHFLEKTELGHLLARFRESD